MLLAFCLSMVVLLFPAVARAQVYNCSVMPGGSGCGTNYTYTSQWIVYNNSGSGTLWCRPQYQNGNLAGGYGWVGPGGRTFNAFGNGLAKMICTWADGGYPIPTQIYDNS